MDAGRWYARPRALGRKQQITTGLAIERPGHSCGFLPGSYELTSALSGRRARHPVRWATGESVASGINDAGEVVGRLRGLSIMPLCGPRTQRLQNLNNLYSTQTPVGCWEQAVAIKPVGQITTIGTHWRPVPRRSFDSHELAQPGVCKKVGGTLALLSPRRSSMISCRLATSTDAGHPDEHSPCSTTPGMSLSLLARPSAPGG